jgi:hypothetical protein
MFAGLFERILHLWADNEGACELVANAARDRALHLTGSFFSCAFGEVG